MKKLLYKYPLISVMLSNIITAFIILFSLNNDKYYLLSVIIINLCNKYMGIIKM